MYYITVLLKSQLMLALVKPSPINKKSKIARKQTFETKFWYQFHCESSIIYDKRSDKVSKLYTSGVLKKKVYGHIS